MIGEGRGRGHGLAIDPAFTLDGCSVFRRAFDPGAEGGEPERSFDFGGNGPGAVAFLKGHFFQGRSAQAATRREK